MSNLGYICFEQTGIDIWEDFDVLPNSEKKMVKYLQEKFPDENIEAVHECDHCGKSFFNYYHINQHFCESLKQVTQPSKSKNNDHTENLGCLNWYKSFKNYLKRKEWPK